MTPEDHDLRSAWAAVEDEYVAALAAFNESNDRVKAGETDPYWQLKRDRLDHAMAQMRSSRQFWRSVGEAVPTEHPGHRNGISVRDNA
jgi:hypothetical protein